MKLLVYELEEMVAHFFKLEAENEGAECYVANSFEDFSFYIDDITPDYLLFDLKLLQKEAQVWHKWWSESSFKDSQIPVVVYGFKEDYLQSEFSKINGLNFLEKPLVHGMVISRIKNLGNPQS